MLPAFNPFTGFSGINLRSTASWNTCRAGELALDEPVPVTDLAAGDGGDVTGGAEMLHHPIAELLEVVRRRQLDVGAAGDVGVDERLEPGSGPRLPRLDQSRLRQLGVEVVADLPEPLGRLAGDGVTGQGRRHEVVDVHPHELAGLAGNLAEPDHGTGAVFGDELDCPPLGLLVVDQARHRATSRPVL
jgi:hypothetical protein